MTTQFITSQDVRKHFLRHVEHELTICVGNNAFDNLKASLAHARALLDSRRFDFVVYINLPFSARRFTDARQDIYPKSEKGSQLIVLHMQQGRLGPDFHGIVQEIKQRIETALPWTMVQELDPFTDRESPTRVRSRRS